MPSTSIPYPKVIAIDNRKKELEDIRDGLLKAGIPCVPLLYDGTYGLEKPPGLNTNHARFVFMDLNLNEEDVSTPARLVDPISDALKSLDIMGPYLLIFWTSYPKSVADVMNLLKVRREDVPLPFYFDTMDKSFLSLPDDETHDKKLEELVTVLSAKLSANKTFNAVLAWENRVTEAASNAVKTLHDTVRERQNCGVAQKEGEFIKLMKYIAYNAWGKAAKDNWGGAIAGGLSPFLADNLDFGISTDGKYAETWSHALDNGYSAKLPKKVSSCSLNTSCTLDTTCTRKEAHGVWLEFKLTCSPEFLQGFGGSGASLLGHFINESKERQSGVEFTPKVKLGILDITRTCDYAARKHGLRRFVLGAIIPATLNDYIYWEDKDNPEKKHDGIYRLPGVFIDLGEGAQECVIQVNFRYVISLPDNSPLLDDTTTNPCFRVRRQVLLDIISKYGAYTTSPGLLSFH